MPNQECIADFKFFGQDYSSIIIDSDDTIGIIIMWYKKESKASQANSKVSYRFKSRYLSDIFFDKFEIHD